MNPNKIIRVVASAGSGKTYNLSTRYIQLASTIFKRLKDREPSPSGGACRKAAASVQPDSLTAILAITFTNKAAAEMKERILLILKEIALRRKNPAGLALTPEEGKKVLFRLIDDFTDFNVMTIDAFMNTILKAFAADVGRLPDYELTFNPRRVYSLALDRLMTREDLSRSFRNFLDHLLTTERKKGFDPEAMIRKALLDLKNRGISPDHLETADLTDFDEMKEWEALRARIAAFYVELAKIQDETRCFSGVSFKPERHLKALETKEFPKWIHDGRALKSLLKKDAVCPRLPVLEAHLQVIREEITRFFTRLEIHKFLRTFEVFKLTQDEEARISRELNTFDGTRLPEKIHELFRDDPALSVPAAFCRLGERYTHYLIDEFQDTSRSQWNAMLPLITNSLSEGGSLYFVGDAKQAIYGWRGGDYRLMEDAYRVMSPAWDPYRDTESLRYNWRSHENLVDFFNTLFDPDGFTPALTDIVPETAVLNDLETVYADNRQEVAGNKKGGYLYARFLPEAGDEREKPIRDAFLEVLREARRGYPDREILILGRKNDEIETIAGWLFELPERIPFVTEQSLKLFTLSPVKPVLNLLSYLSSFDRDRYLLALVHDGLFATIPDDVREEIFSRYDPGEIPFETFFRSAYPDLDAPLVHLRDDAARLSPYELTHEIIRRFNLPERYPGSLPLLERLLEQVLKQEMNGVTHLQEVVEGFYESTEETNLDLPEAPDAVRLMTIHKAKGLEAGVVIIPYLDWTMIPNNSGEIVELEPGRFVRLTASLCRHNPLAEQKKRELDLKSFIENFNLFYVALTRAREALYLLVPPRRRGLGIGKIFHRLAGFYGYLPEGTETLNIGRPRLQGKEKAASGETATHSTSPASAGGVRTLLRLPPESSKGTWLDARARRLGNFAHAALNGLTILPPDAPLPETACRAVEAAARQTGLALDAATFKTLQGLVTSTLQDLKEYFIGIDEAWTEKELVSKEGEIVRIDRLVRKGGNFYVLEFKTGKQEAAHPFQVRRYLRILRSLGITPNPKGILYYLETGEVHHV